MLYLLRENLGAIRSPLAGYMLLLAALAVLALSGGIDTGGAAERTKVEDGLVITRDVPFHEDGHVIDIFRPEEMTRPAPAVIAVHGGTWRHGDGGKMKETAKRIAREGYVVFKVGYRYADKEKKIGAWPGQLNDVKDGIRWVREHAGDYGIDPVRMAAIGSSSGAHIVALIATMNKGPLTEGARVKATVTWSAFLDLPKLRKNKYFPGIKIFLGCKRFCKPKLKRASPIRHVSSDDSAMLLVNGTKELVPKKQPRRMQKKLRRKGVEARREFIKGSNHGQRNADKAMPRTMRFLKNQIGPPALPTHGAARSP